MSQCSITVRGSRLESRLADIEKGRLVTDQRNSGYFVILFADEPDKYGDLIPARHVALQYCQTLWSKEILRKEITIELDSSPEHANASIVEVCFTVPRLEGLMRVDLNLGVGARFKMIANENNKKQIKDLTTALHTLFRSQATEKYPSLQPNDFEVLEIDRVDCINAKLIWYKVGEGD